MKLLFDQNLSHKLVSAVAEQFPHSAHVSELALKHSDDMAIWNYAKSNGFTIVTKDDDFHQLSFLHGAPPKVVWLRMGNCSTSQIEQCLKRCAAILADFEKSLEASYLVLR